MKTIHTLSVTMFLALAACGSPDGAPTTSATSEALEKGASPIAAFDASQYQLAEGLAVRGGHAYVGLAPLGQILELDPDGTRRTYATLPPGYSSGYLLGLAFDDDGTLWALQTNNDGHTGDPKAGVYRIPGRGAAVTEPFATDPKMTFPNGLAFAKDGDLLVTDSAAGAVFRVSRATGAVTTWSADPSLAGSPACPAPLPFPIGANGIVVTDDAAFVTNTAKGALVRIPIGDHGDAGAATPIVQSCAYVGLDGIASNGDDGFVVAQNGGPGRVLAIDTHGHVRELAGGLDGPASVAVARFGTKAPSALVTLSSFFSVGQPGATSTPGLVRIRL